MVTPTLGGRNKASGSAPASSWPRNRPSTLTQRPSPSTTARNPLGCVVTRPSVHR